MSGEPVIEGGHRVQMRWRDLDGLGHVNHTVVLTYLEEGRDAWLEEHGIRRDEYVVGRCSVNFRREIDPAFKAASISCRKLTAQRPTTYSSRRMPCSSSQASRPSSR